MPDRFARGCPRRSARRARAGRGAGHAPAAPAGSRPRSRMKQPFAEGRARRRRAGPRQRSTRLELRRRIRARASVRTASSQSVRLAREGVDAQVAGRHEPGVDAVASHHAPIPSTTSSASRAISIAASRPYRSHQVAEALPPAVDEAAVAPARPAAADVLLEHDDPRVRRPLEDELGGPHAGVAAADDHDVGIGVRRQRGGRGDRPRRPAPRAATSSVGCRVGPSTDGTRRRDRRSIGR